jgi:hypothetical protein
MLQNKLRLLFLFIAVTGLSACEKEVDFHLKNTAPKVVVEGSIETGLPPLVLLTQSIGFFSTIDLNTLKGSFLHDAAITVSDGAQSVSLKEYEIQSQGIPYYFYTVDSADASALNFRGTPGRTYHLTIKYESKTYESSTSIPYPVPLDSLWAQPPPEGEMPADYPNSMLLFAQYKDPDTLGNRVRYSTKRNSEPFLYPLYSVYNDEIVNGTTVQIQLPAGFRKADTIDRETFGYFYKGDTVVVKWSSIDKKTYEFWNTLEFSYGTTGNPFSSPVEVNGNISNGALGVWAGYGNAFDTLIIPR